MTWKFVFIYWSYLSTKNNFAQSAGAVEYTDYFSAEG